MNQRALPETVQGARVFLGDHMNTENTMDSFRQLCLQVFGTMKKIQKYEKIVNFEFELQDHLVFKNRASWSIFSKKSNLLGPREHLGLHLIGINRIVNESRHLELFKMPSPSF